MRYSMNDLKLPTSGAVCVRNYRRRRRDAGLTEVKVWIKESDLFKVRQLLLPFIQAGENQLHLFLGGKYPKHK